MTEMAGFTSHLKAFLQNTWTKSGFQQPTDVQQKAVPFILEGRDLIVESPTGTGKTLAYLLPLLQRIDEEKKDVQAVILAPSRELVMQIFQEIQKWAVGSKISGVSLIGGTNVKNQLEKLKKRPQIIVGTPGRVLELVKLKKLKMHEVKTIVLDEGDQLLLPEHKETVKSVIKTTLRDRQLLLLSATLSKGIEQEAQELMGQAEVIRVQKGSILQADQVEHIYFVCEQRDKIDLLRRIVRMDSIKDSIKALAFVRDIGSLSVLAEKLQYMNVPVAVLHSEADKTERATAIQQFRSGKVPLLLATDVAARGLDIEGLTHVVHLDPPQDASQYVHRSGRTGRMGQSGTVISIVTPREERDLKKLGREIGLSIQEKVLYKGEIRPSKREKPASPKGYNR